MCVYYVCAVTIDKRKTMDLEESEEGYMFKLRQR